MQFSLSMVQALTPIPSNTFLNQLSFCIKLLPAAKVMFVISLNELKTFSGSDSRLLWCKCKDFNDEGNALALMTLTLLPDTSKCCNALALENQLLDIVLKLLFCNSNLVKLQSSRNQSSGNSSSPLSLNNTFFTFRMYWTRWLPKCPLLLTLLSRFFVKFKVANSPTSPNCRNETSSISQINLSDKSKTVLFSIRIA